MMFIRDVLIKSVFVFVSIYVGQIIKYLITHDVNPTLVEIIVSIIIGLYLATKLINYMNN